MKIATAEDFGITIPKWLEWFHDNNDMYAFDEESILTAYCSKTWLNINIYIEIEHNKKKIINITCDSQGSNWKCHCPNGPRDDEWELTFCDIIIDKDKEKKQD
jgi:hypothetical protein